MTETAQVLESLIAAKQKSAEGADRRAEEAAAVVIENIPSKWEVAEHGQLSPKERRKRAQGVADAVIKMQDKKLGKG
jgi:hypothetical protein